jgi:hypothetical protein
MKPKTHVTSVGEWLELPEIPVPRVEDESQRGSLLKVNKVGFFIAALKDCQNAGVVASVVAEGKCFLPTAVVHQKGGPALHRLPMGLLNWVVKCVDLARAGNNLFPSEVEFGELRGQPYAEFLLKRPPLSATP